MLQRVALGQVRFNLPGLSVDARGVVSGKQLVVRFAAMDRLVAFFRALAAEQNLDDLQPGLRIIYARGTFGAREAVVFMPAGSPSSHFGELVARAARLAGGQGFTGTGKHFVQLRDAGAPLGYDAVAPAQETDDFILYGAEQDVAYHVDSELPLAKLLLRLSLQRAGAEVWPADGPVLLVARRGLGPLVAEYLNRARIRTNNAPAMRASAALCDAAPGSAFRTARSFWLFRVEGVPMRLRGLLTRTPGLDLYVPVTDHVAVAAGHRHPIALESCRSSFPNDRLTLFSAREGVVEIAPRPVFTPVEDVVRIRPPAAQEVERAPARDAGRPEISVPLRLEPSADARRPTVAVLVPWAHVPWLRRVCYALPMSALRGYRLAVLERGVLVLASGALEGMPFGVLLAAAAPGVDVLVPLGTRLRPAVSPELLAERLGAQGGALVVFPALGAPPFRVDATLVEPLDHRALAGLSRPTSEAGVSRSVESASAAVEIENEPLGPMPLWGLDR